MDKITAYVGQVPQKFYQKKRIPRLPLILIALIAGSIGAYALINSLAASTCTPDLDHLVVSSGCPVTKSDTAASGSDSVIEGLWGHIECVDPSRLQQITTGGDSHNTANGTSQGNTSYYKLTTIDGDDYYGERCELGRNERRYGENGGAGTFQLYQQGEHKITFVSIRLPSNLPTNVQAWQTIMQMKQTQPSNTAGNSPIIEMQEYGNLFRIESDPAGELWTTQAVAGQWVRFAFDVTYSPDNSTGKVKVYADLNGDGDTLDPGEQSPVITTATLATQYGQTSLGDPPLLHVGDPVPGHLRLGIYHNPSYNCPAPAGCSTDDDNVQVVDLTGITITPPDNTAPTVSLTAPANGATVSGSSTAVSATASDNTGVAGVQFKLDGNNLGSEDTSSPYSTTWNTTAAANGAHTLTAVASDAAGNTKTSGSVSVTVNNTSQVAGCTDVLNAGGNLQNFLNGLQPGDTGCVRAGTYGARGTITNFSSTGTGNNPIIMKNYPGDARPTILGQFRVTGSYQTVSGFLFDGPTGQVTTNPQDVVVWIYGANNATFADSEVRNGQYHAGIFVSGVTNAKILRSYIHDNGDFNDPAQANLDHGIYWADGSGVIADNLIKHNYAYGVHLYPAADNVVVENNTITGHTGRGAVIVASDSTNTVVANNILSDNLYGLKTFSLTGANNTANTNLFWNNSGGDLVGISGLTVTNSIFGNPLFAGTNDYHLTAGSPAINKANSSYVVSPDYAGTARPQGAGSDIGAYEFTGSTSSDTTNPTVSLTAPYQGTTVSGRVPLAADATDDTGVTKVEFYADNTLISTSTSSHYTAIWNAISATAGNHTLTAKAYDAAGNVGTSSIVAVTVLANPPNASGIPKDGNVLLALANPGTPFASTSFWNTPLPSSTPLNVNSSVYVNTILANLNGQQYATGGSLNNNTWSSSMYVVPANQPHVPVGLYCSDGSAAGGKPGFVNSVLAGGIPIPPNAHSAAGSDESITIYQPSTDTDWEFWRLQKDANGGWVACWGGRIDNVSQSDGIFPHPYGSSATGLPHLGAIARIEELQAGHVDHPINITLPNYTSSSMILNPSVLPANILGATNGFSWPANRADGKSTDPLSIPEGQRFRLPANLDLNQYSLSPVAKTIAVAAQKYGFVVVDGGGSVSIRVGDPTTYTEAGFADPYIQLFGADYNNPSRVMLNFPWDKLQALPFNYGEPSPSDTTPPSISFTSPVNGGTVSGIVTATAAASDNVGVSKVELSLDGSLKMTDTASPYNYSFDSKTLTNGSHTLSAKAYDAAGNATTATITVTVSNPDITPPNAPTNLNATAASPTTVNLTWTAATDTGANQTGVTKYNVLRNGVVIAQPTTNSYSDTNRTANTTYSYTVQAIDGANNTSANSNTDSVTTPTVPDTIPPTTPANLAASAASINQINLSWNASTDASSGIAGYNVYRNGTKLNTTPVTTNSYGDSTVTAATTYSYKVEAIDGAGNKSTQTAAVSATTPPVVRGDVTGPSGAPDGKINLQDVSFEIRNYNTADTTADISGPSNKPDGKVDIYDMSYIIRNYGG